MELTLIIVSWFIAGGLFWVRAMQWNGWPDHWITRGRVQGWSDALVDLLICIIGGPIWWLLFIILRALEPRHGYQNFQSLIVTGVAAGVVLIFGAVVLFLYVWV